MYVLMDKVLYAEGPDGEGELALTDARSCPDVTLSFDQKAHLPDKNTMTPLETSALELLVATDCVVRSTFGIDSIWGAAVKVRNSLARADIPRGCQASCSMPAWRAR